MFYGILDPARSALLPALAAFKDRFYLAGGTGLALWLGHRRSIDFDFFTAEPFDADTLNAEIAGIFAGREYTVTGLEARTLHAIAGGVRLSFLGYRSPLLEPLTQEPRLSIASVTDIGCMKLSAVVSRATMKDFVDVYEILKHQSLADLVAAAARKLPELDRLLVLKSLNYFDDIADEHLDWMPGREVPFSHVKESITEEIRKIALH